MQVAGDIDDLLSTHHRLTGPRRDGLRPPSGWEVLAESATERQSTLVVRHERPVLDPAWTIDELGLEDLVLAYMGRAASNGRGQRQALVGISS